MLVPRVCDRIVRPEVRLGSIPVCAENATHHKAEVCTRRVDPCVRREHPQSDNMDQDDRADDDPSQSHHLYSAGCIMRLQDLLSRVESGNNSNQHAQGGAPRQVRVPQGAVWTTVAGARTF
jgi:hypothetical protein